ncbi:FKBP-type peptidyl-prolyl cis-trans isomerase [Neisseria chenwenguii]|uniref:Peptidyl-prolyl cis-trans isomerase n=1 Tax=Neisseria chenwenguii TaxID=1853278 RepID=A0A220RZF8_9NEIS|nr:FKBP-type peptidyl-prolyl cis-trans isomerase [Neisseria chenwenguii]ASK26528.1 peptidylprolyl isomerase [Neisseria chenwenguii]ROV55970.1 FKBP-type peptidyl-prolyl cis-trans isomerase [Neisseria chenwenguii]
MNKTFKFGALAIAAALALTACDKKDAAGKPASAPAVSAASGAAAASNIGTPAQQASYAMGIDIGRTLKQMKDQGTEVDLKVFNEALQTMYDGKEPKMSEMQAQEVMMKFLQEQQAKAQAKFQADAKTNLEKGNAFLAENGKKQGVKTTASGLQYTVKTEGTGKQPKATDVVTVEYEGRLIDGTVFDSSKQNGLPATFPLNQVIPGWTEAVQLMKEGGEATFFIPAKLAYGERGAGEKIGPNSTLVFDVKLVKVGAPEGAAPAQPEVKMDVKKVQ